MAGSIRTNLPGFWTCGHSNVHVGDSSRRLLRIERNITGNSLLVKRIGCLFARIAGDQPSRCRADEDLGKVAASGRMRLPHASRELPGASCYHQMPTAQAQHSARHGRRPGRRITRGDVRGPAGQPGNIRPGEPFPSSVPMNRLQAKPPLHYLPCRRDG